MAERAMNKDSDMKNLDSMNVLGVKRHDRGTIAPLISRQRRRVVRAGFT